MAVGVIRRARSRNGFILDFGSGVSDKDGIFPLVEISIKSG